MCLLEIIVSGGYTNLLTKKMEENVMQAMGNLFLPTFLNYHLKRKTLSLSPTVNEDYPQYYKEFNDFYLKFSFVDSKFHIDYFNSTDDELLSDWLGLNTMLGVGNLEIESFETIQLRALQALLPFMNKLDREKYYQMLN